MLVSTITPWCDRRWPKVRDRCDRVSAARDTKDDVTTDSLAEGILTRDQRAIARAITLVENGSLEGPMLIRGLFGRSGRAQIIGVTGAPGVGKSTLVNCMTTEWRRRQRTVGILAIDPTSPFSGGAVLGDRIRMQSHSGDSGVYVRSMASRGHLGGLAQATNDATVILDAAGFDMVIVETVGVGQGEVDIVRTADCSIVVMVPGTGDDVQAIKAGIMEIADIFVVNKADREGADRAVSEIEAALMLQPVGAEEWRAPVLKAEAARGIGVNDLLDTVEIFGQRHETDRDRLRARAEVRLRETLSRQYLARLERHDDTRAALEDAVERIASRDIDPYTAAAEIMERA
jgi:LAO/AO transport system kinase